MPDASRPAPRPHPRQDAPAWPPYIARIEDEDDVFALDAAPQPTGPRTAVVTWQPPPVANPERAGARPFAPPREEMPPPHRDRLRGSGMPAPHNRSGNAPAEGEVLFADFDAATRRAISHRPIIALTVNALGYHLFISHAARRLLSKLILIGVGALLALLWGDLTDVAELLVGVFAH